MSDKVVVGLFDVYVDNVLYEVVDTNSEIFKTNNNYSH